MNSPTDAARVRAGVVIPAGGAGRRMGGACKPFLDLAGRPLLQHTLEPFLRSADVAQIAVALPSDIMVDPPQWLVDLAPRVLLVAGGTERGDSVRHGIDALDQDISVILVHDAARPLVTDDIVRRCIDAAAAGRAVIAAIPVTDTIKQVNDSGRITGTPDRSGLWAAQTPQAFPAPMLRDAVARAAADDFHATDDAALVERLGIEVAVVHGSAENVKVTSPADMFVAEAVLARRNR
jgi:2-C-methyl-D-erythritol 4-phosphate cytidylyltransferase